MTRAVRWYVSTEKQNLSAAVECPRRLARDSISKEVLLSNTNPFSSVQFDSSSVRNRSIPDRQKLTLDVLFCQGSLTPTEEVSASPVLMGLG